MDQPLLVDRDEPFARFTINRPDKGNMLTLDGMVELAEAIAKSGSDPAIKAVVLTGTGEEFCRGRDPESAPERAPTTALEMKAALIEPILGVYAAIRGAEVPVIAAVRGLANGFGAALAGACDVTIATDDTRFAFPEMKADLPPTLAMCAVIDRLPSKALAWLVYSTDQIDAATALTIGLVSRVVPSAELDAELSRFLDGLSQRSRVSCCTVKRYLADVRTMNSTQAADLAGNMLAVVLSSR